MRSPAELSQRLRAEGRKVTPQREAVIRVLSGNEGHPTADAVHAAVVAELPMVSLRTVYQVLNDLSELGEIQAIDVGTGAARFDPNVDPHHHLVCTVCGRVRDVPALPVPAVEVGGFVVERAEIVFRGRCETCDPD
ncbi:MAG TPA: Fur family transcriptional regulator [Acidimicrobiales bacterium]